MRYLWRNFVQASGFALCAAVAATGGGGPAAAQSCGAAAAAFGAGEASGGNISALMARTLVEAHALERKAALSGRPNPSLGGVYIKLWSQTDAQDSSLAAAIITYEGLDGGAHNHASELVVFDFTRQTPIFAETYPFAAMANCEDEDVFHDVLAFDQQCVSVRLGGRCRHERDEYDWSDDVVRTFWFGN